MSPGYRFVLLTLLFTVYGQLVLKWRLNQLNLSWGEGIWEKAKGMLGLLFDPYIFSGFFAAFLAAMCWMAAMSKLPITVAYPFMSLAPALVFIFGVWFLNEDFSWGKVFGLALIGLGIFVTVKY
jgi:undecaprenyl phosphate-alpha-L-ara4N flippase subunit ArnF